MGLFDGLKDDFKKAADTVRDVTKTGNDALKLGEKASEALTPAPAASAPEAAASAPGKPQCTPEQALKIAEARERDLANKQKAAESAARHGSQIASGDIGSMISGGLGLLRDKAKAEKAPKLPDCELLPPSQTPKPAAPATAPAKTGGRE